MVCSSQQYQNCLKDRRNLPEGDADIAITARWKEGGSGPWHRWCLKYTTHCFTGRGGGETTKRSIPLCADFMTHYLHQSFAGPQPSAKDLLSWNQSANYIVTGGFKSLARKYNKINKNQLGKFCLTTHFFPHSVHGHVERHGMNQPILVAQDKPGYITAPVHGEYPPKGCVYPAGANAIPTQSL